MSELREDATDGGDEEKPKAATNPIIAMFSTARYPSPYSMFHDKPAEKEGVSTDSIGFCNRAAPVSPKPPGEKRVFLFGNSAIRRGGFKNSIPVMLERVFREKGREDVKVYNMGIGSAINGQFLMYLVQQGIDLEPDLVITYDGYVDLAIPHIYDPRPGYTYNHYMLELMHEYLGENRLHELDIVKAESARRTELRKAIGWRSAEWEDALVAAYTGTIRKTHELAGFYGFKAYSCLQPIVAGKKTKQGLEAKFNSAAPAYILTLKLFAMARAAFPALASRFSGSPSSRFGDLSRLFEDDPEERFADMTHMNFDAHIPIAEKLYREIEGLI